MAPMDTQLKVPTPELPRYTVYTPVRSASVGRFHSNHGGPRWTLVTTDGLRFGCESRESDVTYLRPWVLNCEGFQMNYTWRPCLAACGRDMGVSQQMHSSTLSRCGIRHPN